MPKAKTKGLEGLFIDTHDWEKSLTFWKGLGYKVVFETDHKSGELRHPNGGPYIFLAERPKQKLIGFVPVVSVTDAKTFRPPKTGKVQTPFQAEHWGVLGMDLQDPDQRALKVLAPLKKKKTKK